MPLLHRVRDLRLGVDQDLETDTAPQGKPPEVDALVLRLDAAQMAPRARNALARTFPQPPDTLTVAEVAHRLQLCKRTVQQMASDGKLPVVKVSNRYRIPREQFQQFLEGKWSPSIAGQAPATSLHATGTRRRAV